MPRDQPSHSHPCPPARSGQQGSSYSRPAAPKPGMLVGISMPYLHFSASSRRSKHPVPAGASWPSMMFSDTPFMGSLSPCAAASISTSTCMTGRRGARETAPHPVLRGAAAQVTLVHPVFLQCSPPPLHPPPCSIVTVSSKEHFMRGPVSWRLTPCRVMAIRWPRQVMVSHSRAKWR